MYFPIIDALKENFIAKIPSIVTKWLTDNVDPAGSAVVVDRSLSISGAAADAKITGDEIRDLKSDFSGKTLTKEVTTANTKNYIDFYFLKGQTVKFNNNCNASVYVSLYEKNGTGHTINDDLNAGKSITFTVEYDNCIRIGGYCGGTGSISVEVIGVYDQFEQTDEKIADVRAFVEGNGTTEIGDLQFTTGAFIRYSDGSIIDSANFKYSDFIPVNKGDEIPYSLHGANNVVAVISAYDSTNSFIRNASVSSDGISGSGSTVLLNGTYVVPSGVSKIRVCNWSNATSASDSISIPYKYSLVQKNAEDIQTIEEELGNIDIVNQWKDKKWVAFGTSITDNYSQNSYITQGEHTGEHTGKYVPYLLDMSELSQSAFINRGIAGGSINGHILYYLRYYASDMANADLITIEGAVNDFATSIPLGNVGDTVPYTNSLLTDSTAEGTFAGACYQAFITALENAPHAVVVLLTETTGNDHTGYANYNQLRKNTLGLYQDDYIRMTMAVAEFVGIPVINCGRDSMINAQNPQYIADHIHHTYLGGYQYARTIWAKLKGIPLKALTVPN